MAKQTINTGAAPNDGTGDTLRVAFTKTNNNFTELYNTLALGTIQIGQIIAFANATSSVSNGAAWAANSGIRQLNTFDSNTSNTIYATEDNSIILCDPGSVGSNITVVLPDDAYIGKIYTIKNINAASYVVTITCNTSNSIETLFPVFPSGQFANSSTLIENAEFVTYVCDNLGLYRRIG